MMERLNEPKGKAYLSDTRIVVVARNIPQGEAANLAAALYRAGIRVMEVTMNTNGAVQMIQELRCLYGDKMWIGAGTVVSKEHCEAALAAGAEFLVTPNVDEHVIGFASEHNVPVFPGAMTPTEIYRAYTLGATAIKVFPIRSLGAQYLKDVHGPFPDIPLMAVGGVSALNAPDFLKAGAVAVGVGGNLVDTKLVAAGDFDLIEANARKLVEAVQNAIS